MPASKPSGKIELNPSHALYSYIKALIVIEDDGTVREIVSGKTGSSVTATVGNSGDKGATVQCDVNMEAEIAVLDLANNSEFSHVVFSDLDRPASGTTPLILCVTDDPTDMSRSYSCVFGNDYRNSTNVRNFLRGGWSGTKISLDNCEHENGDYGICGTAVDIDGVGDFDSNIFDSPDEFGTDTDDLNQTYDANNGSNDYIHLKPPSAATETPVVYYGMILSKKLSQTEFQNLDADPWDVVQEAAVAAAGRTYPRGVGRGNCRGVA
ncbi:MAG: hypothetical protein GTN53_01020 [Candidatus Aminicenantes bacterium]|nr:hypothetical protein [Candidatus Aminicenantes bacterium]NIQ65796.1 hypothetical protein [Candidatus Aminicenantes bacterium]NIT21078.1 hypothetical protein [Candidatus Aminicenantes bacterium]